MPGPSFKSSPSFGGNKITDVGDPTDAQDAATRAWVLAAAVAKATFPVTIGMAASDETTDLTTGVDKVSFRVPFAFTLTSVYASVNVASSSGLVTVDINEGGVSVLSTKLTIDANETSSATAATAAVISDSSIAADGLITVDIDGAGTGAKGLKVWLTGTRSV